MDLLVLDHYSSVSALSCTGFLPPGWTPNHLSFSLVGSPLGLGYNGQYCWLVAGIALIRILRAKLDAGAHVEAIKVNAEVEIVK